MPIVLRPEEEDRIVDTTQPVDTKPRYTFEPIYLENLPVPEGIVNRRELSAEVQIRARTIEQSRAVEAMGSDLQEALYLTEKLLNKADIQNNGRLVGNAAELAREYHETIAPIWDKAVKATIATGTPEHLAAEAVRELREQVELASVHFSAAMLMQNEPAGRYASELKKEALTSFVGSLEPGVTP